MEDTRVIIAVRLSTFERKFFVQKMAGIYFVDHISEATRYNPELVKVAIEHYDDRDDSGEYDVFLCEVNDAAITPVQRLRTGSL